MEARFRFYAELNELLPPMKRQRELVVGFPTPVPVKDRIESCGIPHTEVAFIQVNGAPAGFAHRLQDGDRVSVYPFMAILENPLPLRPPYPRGRFVLDQHLARLAVYLRLMGLDALHRRHFPDEEVARVSIEEDRVLLTRDKGLLMRGLVVHGGFVRATDPMAQLPEVLHRFGARECYAPFTRCLACNGVLLPIAKAEVAARLLPGTREHYESFWTCPSCGRVFWEGPHVRRMRGWVEGWLRHPDLA
ncbi:MAG TPA: Mut7-C RNAse domain-containing protein [Holophaga sp.]|nr:Mut7-C RNAse domain-containing protein [Holophaga sp.]